MLWVVATLLVLELMVDERAVLLGGRFLDRLEMLLVLVFSFFMLPLLHSIAWDLRLTVLML